MSESTGHILVVDDNQLNRQKLQMMLKIQGHTVALATDGLEALRMLNEENFDVVLLDIVMPGLDGHGVLERMKADPRLRDIPVIVISSLDETDTIVRCIEQGAEDYLPKSFNPVVLRARIEASLHKKRLREMESAYLRQEVALRQTEKLATLGKLSAGLAHELNNPAAAVMRGATLVQQRLPKLQESCRRLGDLRPSDSQVACLTRLDSIARRRSTDPLTLDALTRSDRESELEAWMTDRGITDAWKVVPTLVELDLPQSDWEDIVANFGAEHLPLVVNWLDHSHAVYSLAMEIGEGAERMAQIVHALKSYSYMDQAPLKEVDVVRGIENTLVILRNKLKHGVTVHREFEESLPKIQAYGGELNQVWTNLIDNAIDAMNGEGELRLRGYRDGQSIVVEIEDNGSGIPDNVKTQIFDPFFTTKPPGSGTGLGLSISHNIVVTKHGGQLQLESEPGRTRFIVRLPLVAAGDGSAEA
jgi:signal transduction histidine kinase